MNHWPPLRSAEPVLDVSFVNIPSQCTINWCDCQVPTVALPWNFPTLDQIHRTPQTMHRRQSKLQHKEDLVKWHGRNVVAPRGTICTHNSTHQQQTTTVPPLGRILPNHEPIGTMVFPIKLYQRIYMTLLLSLVQMLLTWFDIGICWKCIILSILQ